MSVSPHAHGYYVINAGNVSRHDLLQQLAKFFIPSSRHFYKAPKNKYKKNVSLLGDVCSFSGVRKSNCFTHGMT